MLMPKDHFENDWSSSNTVLFRVSIHLTVCLVPDLRFLAECILMFLCMSWPPQGMPGLPMTLSPGLPSWLPPSLCAWLTASSLGSFSFFRT